jgi:preprotein translocase subunit SecG
MSIVLGILTFILILVSIFLVLVVLMQKSKDGGMGAALGGGAAEAAFGADTSNVLSKSTIYAAVLFFVLAFVLYLGRIYERTNANTAAGSALPAISSPAAPAPATPTPVPGAEASTAAPGVTVPTTATPAAPAPESTPTAPEGAKK